MTIMKVKIDILNLNYSQIVGIVQERNRPSGGIKSIHEVAMNAFINNKTQMLEIGSNTGFTSVNMSLLTGCKVIGIDMIKESIKEAERYASEQGVSDRTKFMQADALALPFMNETFDIVWCSNVTSFVSNKDKAIGEYLRVLKKGGILVVIPIYYLKKPPNSLLKKVSESIGTKIEAWDKQFWKDLFINIANKSGYAIEEIYESNHVYVNVDDNINNYVNNILSKKHLNYLQVDELKIIKKKYAEYIKLFNKNLKYAGYSIILYQKRNTKDEIELFISKRI